MTVLLRERGASRVKAGRKFSQFRGITENDDDEVAGRPFPAGTHLTQFVC